MPRLTSAAVLVAVLALPLLADDDKSRVPTHYVVQCTIVEVRSNELGENEAPRTLANPTLALIEGRESSILVGGEVNVGSEKVRFGTSLKVKVEPAEDAKVRVNGVLELSTLGTVSDGIVVRKGAAVHFAKTATCGERIRLPMPETDNSSGWFEMLIERRD